MGKASRWLKAILGIKREKAHPLAGDRKTTTNFMNSSKSSSGDSPLQRSFQERETALNKQAIAVAVATSAAADAAVSAAQAAMAVLKLTTYSGGQKIPAAVKIQSLFRGYLARKALRALKGLVKIQALVRGFVIRKRAVAALHSMEALIRAQTAIQSQRYCRGFQNKIPPDPRRRNTMETVCNQRNEFHSKRLSSYSEAHDRSPRMVEFDDFKSRSRSTRMYLMPRDAIRSSSLSGPIPGRISIAGGWKELDRSFNGDRTTQNTPRFANLELSKAVSPSKSACGDGFFARYSNYRNYMADTESYRAKLRSKERMRVGLEKRLSLDEIRESTNRISCVKMRRSCNQARRNFNF